MRLDIYDNEDLNREIETLFGTFTRGQMQAAFDKVRDKDDWRAPIVAIIHESNLAVTRAAVQFFTGTLLTLKSKSDRGFCVVMATGFKNGPEGLEVELW